MAADGSFAISVSTDRKILLFDIRCQKAVASIDASEYPEMHDVALSNQTQSSLENNGMGPHGVNMASIGSTLSAAGGASPDSNNQMHLGDSMNGFAAIGHNDGSVSIWNLMMR